jgi:hypothetical protein
MTETELLVAYGATDAINALRQDGYYVVDVERMVSGHLRGHSERGERPHRPQSAPNSGIDFVHKPVAARGFASDTHVAPGRARQPVSEALS